MQTHIVRDGHRQHEPPVIPLARARAHATDERSKTVTQLRRFFGVDKKKGSRTGYDPIFVVLCLKRAWRFFHRLALFFFLFFLPALLLEVRY